MGDYTGNIKKEKLGNVKIKIRNLNTEYLWAEYSMRCTEKKLGEEYHTWNTPGESNTTIIKDGSILFSDATGICYTDVKEIPPKYKYMTTS